MMAKLPNLTLLVLAAALPLAACDKGEATATGTASATTAATSKQTLLSALGTGDLGTFKQAIETAQLGSLFEGPASYTVLAPTDDAFAALGDQGNALLQPDQRALLVAVLRYHLLPGHLDTAAIEKALAAKNGPVTMTTLGEGTVTFAKDGDGIVVTGSDGGKARLVTSATQASNGVVLPIDSVLLPKESASIAQ